MRTSRVDPPGGAEAVEEVAAIGAVRAVGTAGTVRAIEIFQRNLFFIFIDESIYLFVSITMNEY